MILKGTLKLFLCSLITLSAFKAIAVGEVNKDRQEYLTARTMLGVIPIQTGLGVKVVIRAVAPNSTAVVMGIKPNDKLLTIDNQEIPDFGGLINLLSNKKVNESVRFSVERDGKIIILEGKMQARTQEKSDNAKVVYDTVFWNKQRLRSIIYTPNQVLKENSKAPAIFYIQGYTCDSIDYGYSPNITTLQLINQFIKAGYVVYRAEKFGVGDSKGAMQCRDVNFTEEVAGFTAA